MILLDLFLSFLQIGLFSFGGGYAAIPLIQNQVIELHRWLSISEFTDLITISQMTPGPIAINSATFVGMKIAGIPGALVATIGCILPSCVIVTSIAFLYLKYRHLKPLQDVLSTLRPAVIALIATAGLSIIITSFFGEAASISFNNLHIAMMIIYIFCFYLLYFKKQNAIFVMFIAGILNVIQYFILGGLV